MAFNTKLPNMHTTSRSNSKQIKHFKQTKTSAIQGKGKDLSTLLQQAESFELVAADFYASDLSHTQAKTETCCILFNMKL